MGTREKLVEAAADLFARHGYTATGMTEILREARVHRGSLYHAFPSKKDLLLAVLDRRLAHLETQVVEPAWRDVADPIERVFALLNRYREFLEGSDCRFGCPIGSLALELHDADEEVRARLAANFRAWIGHVERCFVEAGSRLPPDTDRRALATFALTTMEGGVMLSRTERTTAGFDNAVGQLRDYVSRLEAAANG